MAAYNESIKSNIAEINALKAFALGLDYKIEHQKVFLLKILDRFCKSLENLDNSDHNKSQKVIVHSIYDIVKHSGYCCIYKLKNFLTILVKMYPEVDTELVDSARTLNKQLQNNYLNITDNDPVNVEEVKLSDCIVYMKVILKYESKQLRLLVISWFNTFLENNSRIEFIKYLNLFICELIYLFNVCDKNSDIFNHLQECLKEMRKKFVESSHIKDNQFCMELLSCFIDFFENKSNFVCKEQKLELLNWIE